MSVHLHPTAYRQQGRDATDPPSGGGSEPPMELSERVANLEVAAEKANDRLTNIDLRLARIEAKQDEFSRYYATKADVLDAKNSIIMWVVSAVLLAQILPAILKKFGA